LTARRSSADTAAAFLARYERRAGELALSAQAGIEWLSFSPVYPKPSVSNSNFTGAHAFRPEAARSLCGYLLRERAGEPADDVARRCTWCKRVVAGIAAGRDSSVLAAVDAHEVDDIAAAGSSQEPAASPAAELAPPPAAELGMKICTRCKMRPALAGRPGPYRCAECAASPAKRERNRRYRDDRPRARMIGRAEIARQVRAHAEVDTDEPSVETPARPVTRGDCENEPRPCPWVACKHHLYLDINPQTGSIKINFPDLEPWELKHTCALDVAERGGITLEEVGEIMNLTRERIRQVEVRGLLKIKMASPSADELGARPDSLAAAGIEVEA
jgi:sigma-70-like protein